jgi:leukotriene-A4 hydrolase
VQDLTCTDPDDFFSGIPYEKGSQLLYWLEKAVVQNSPLTFESCIQAWIKKHVHGNVTSEEFERFFEDYYANDPEVLPRLAQIPWHAWFHDRDPRGCPVDVLKYCDASLVKAANDLAKSMTICVLFFCSLLFRSVWIDTKGASGVNKSDVSSFNTQSRLLFLQALEGKIDADTFRRIDQVYHFSAIRNPEVRFAWLMQGLALKVAQPDFLRDVEAMLSQQGRMKFTRPLYRSLAAVDRARALAVFAENTSSYHPVCVRLVQKDFDDSQRN